MSCRRSSPGPLRATLRSPTRNASFTSPKATSKRQIRLRRRQEPAHTLFCRQEAERNGREMVERNERPAEEKLPDAESSSSFGTYDEDLGLSLTALRTELLSSATLTPGFHLSHKGLQARTIPSNSLRPTTHFCPLRSGLEDPVAARTANDPFGPSDHGHGCSSRPEETSPTSERSSITARGSPVESP